MIEQLAIKYSINHPDIPTTLVSTSNPENIIRNIKWAEAPINERLLGEVLNILKPINRLTWENS